MNNDYFFAIDLGATSGRTIVGRINDGKVEQQEITRFPNNLTHHGGHVYWNIHALYLEIIKGLKEVAHRGITITSIGIDTWGVDFVCIGDDGTILGEPRAYRDPSTADAMDDYLNNVMSRRDIYRITGIQIMSINSLFQFHAMRRQGNSALKAARHILFIPDALAWMLTGEMVCEYTIASTSQMLDSNTREFSTTLLDSIGLDRKMFGRMVEPGTTIGTLSAEIQGMTGLGAVPVIAVAGHDTASAVAAVPAQDRSFAYLSSGTWSLMGIETAHAIVNDRSYELNFTNEGGIEHTTRFLKNICGMWLYESCRREFNESMRQLSHTELQVMARQVEPFRSIIFPDDTLFANPQSMTDAIKTYCRNTHQPVPETPAEICRCIFDSLALRYRQVFGYLKELSAATTPAENGIKVLNIIGGGSLNTMLNQSAANALNIEVLAGPQECTAIGNIMVQAKAAGMVTDRWQMRQIIANSTQLTAYHPTNRETWDAAYDKYMNIITQK